MTWTRVVERSIRMVTQGTATAVNGEEIEVKADTFCLHGDTPGARDMAVALKSGLEAAGVEIVPLSRARVARDPAAPRMYQRPSYLPAGDRALSVEFGNAISPDISSRVRAFYTAIEAQNVPGVLELVPHLPGDPGLLRPPGRRLLRPGGDSLESLEAAQADAPRSAPSVVEIPTVYGGEYGPDLEHVSQHCGLPQDEVVRIHTGTDYLIYMMGFTPGFPYLGGMSERIATPRLQTPRTIIPAGSVGIAEKQTGVYPIESPGGWQLIGRTPVRLFDTGRDPPVIVEAGDYLRFVPVTEETFQQLAKEVESGLYQPVVRAPGE